MRSSRVSLVAAAALVCATLGLSGCAGGSGYEDLVASGDRFANQTVGPEYLAYVEADARLDQNEKQVRADNVEAFRRAIEAAKADKPAPRVTNATGRTR